MESKLQPELAIEIIYQDDALLAVNKPAGLPVIPDGFDPDKPNLHHVLSQTYGRLWVVHRLDKDTSGVILFARSAEIHRQLNVQFEHRALSKTYHLLTWGPVPWESLTVNYPLRINGDRNHRTIIDVHNSKPAQTDFNLLERFSGKISLLSASPFSGYTHQIRAHCAATGLWLVNDPLYLPHPIPPSADFQPPHRSDLLPQVEYLPISRTALHAQQISFHHPDTNLPLTLQASYSRDFTETLKLLRFH
ncbi:MAG TPA: RluA family pseudouridine synthase [Bellilinea sp.]|nr:RluA family pseudouridine synthase [Bellilinea sp.]